MRLLRNMKKNLTKLEQALLVYELKENLKHLFFYDTNSRTFEIKGMSVEDAIAINKVLRKVVLRKIERIKK